MFSIFLGSLPQFTVKLRIYIKKKKKTLHLQVVSFYSEFVQVKYTMPLIDGLINIHKVLRNTSS